MNLSKFVQKKSPVPPPAKELPVAKPPATSAAIVRPVQPPVARHPNTQLTPPPAAPTQPPVASPYAPPHASAEQLRIAAGVPARRSKATRMFRYGR